MTVSIHPSAGVNRDSLYNGYGPLTLFVIRVMFSLNSRGKWHTADFGPELNLILDMLRKSITIIIE